MSCPASDFFQQVWSEALRVVLHQQQWTGHTKKHLTKVWDGDLVNQRSGLLTCPCMMNHALLLPSISTKRRKRKRRKKRNNSKNVSDVAILHSFRYLTQ